MAKLRPPWTTLLRSIVRGCTKEFVMPSHKESEATRSLPHEEDRRGVYRRAGSSFSNPDPGPRTRSPNRQAAKTMRSLLAWQTRPCSSAPAGRGPSGFGCSTRRARLNDPTRRSRCTSHRWGRPTGGARWSPSATSGFAGCGSKASVAAGRTRASKSRTFAVPVDDTLRRVRQRAHAARVAAGERHGPDGRSAQEHAPDLG